LKNIESTEEHQLVVQHKFNTPLDLQMGRKWVLCVWKMSHSLHVKHTL